MNRSTFQTIKYINGPVFIKCQVMKWDRFQNTSLHSRSTFTHQGPPHIWLFHSSLWAGNHPTHYIKRSHGWFRKKKVREKSRECHKNKPQPFPDTKRKRKQTKPNKRKSNKRTKSNKICFLFPKRCNSYAKRTEKTQDQNNTRKDLNQIALQNEPQSNKE